MKKLIIAFLLILPIAACAKTSSFEGVWYLNKSINYDEGIMTIENCTEYQCDFNLNSSQHGHTCEADGHLIIKDDDTAEYKSKKYEYNRKTNTEKFLPVGIIFEILPNENMNLRYSNTDSYSAFCGLNATVEGTWVKSEINTP